MQYDNEMCNKGKFVKQKQFALNVLKDFINKKDTTIINNPDWEWLYQTAQQHQIQAILYYQCKNFMPQGCKDSFLSSYSMTISSFVNRNALIQKITELLKSSYIDHIFIKGPAVSQHYPQPAFRTMGDLDIVVKAEDKEKANTQFIENGFQLLVKEDRDWHYSCNGFTIELHDKLFYPSNINSEYQVSFFDGIWNYCGESDGFRKELDWNFHLLFLLEHMKSHFLFGGIGLRMFLDIAIVCKTQVIDYEWIRIESEKLGIAAFANNVFSLCNVWFEVDIPVPSVSDKFIDSATELIFTNGVFGFDNDDNCRNAEINAIRNSNNKNKKISMIRNSFRKMFPSYENMRGVSYYRFIDGKPWLLPIAWMYRPIKTIRNKRLRYGVDQISRSFVPSDELLKREILLEEWGL